MLVGGIPLAIFNEVDLIHGNTLFGVLIRVVVYFTFQTLPVDGREDAMVELVESTLVLLQKISLGKVTEQTLIELVTFETSDIALASS